MKKLALVFGILIALTYSFGSINSYAQTESSSTKKELKEEKKIQKAKVNLEKSRLKLTKAKEKYNSNLSKFEKRNSAGKLSPNAVAKILLTLKTKEKR